MNDFKLTVSIIVGLIFLLGCSIFSAQPENSGIPPMSATTKPQNNNLRTVTSPITPSSVVSTPLISPTTTLTLTPVLSTLSPMQSSEIIFDLYTNNGGCELPCWWGIVPGKTTLQDVYSRFSNFGKFKDDTRPMEKLLHYGFTLVPPDEIDKYKEGKWSFQLVIENKMVVGITTAGYTNRLFSNPSWTTFLAAFREPEEIWIAVTKHRDGPPSYDMVLFYPQKGILVMGSGVTHVITETETSVKVSICPGEMPLTIDMISHYPPGLHLWSLHQQKSFPEINAENLLRQPYRLLDSSMTDITTNHFYNIYIDSATTQCFDVSWLWNPR